MKLQIERKKLSDALGVVSRALGSQSSINDALKCILASVESSGILSLRTTDLTISISLSVETEVSEEGALAIPGRSLTDWVKIVDDDLVSFAREGKNTLSLKCGSSTASIKCLSADLFPLQEFEETDWFEVDVAQFKGALDRTMFAASKLDARPVLTGVLVTLEGKELTLAAADGYRLSLCNLELSTAARDCLQAIVPAIALADLTRILPREGVLAISIGQHWASFRSDAVELTTQTIHGYYPDVMAVVPTGSKTKLIASVKEVSRACLAADVIARENGHTIILDINPGDPGKLEISSKESHVGSSEIVMDAIVEGDPLRIGFNAEYLSQGINAVGQKNVELLFATKSSPLLLQPSDSNGYRHVIMPMHIPD